jgi:hypothetical protein
MKAPNDHRLVELLRDADPAADAAELTDAEARAIRRAALRALPVRRPSWLATPAWSAAIAAAVVALLAVGIVVALRNVTPPPEAARQAGGSATVPRVPPTVPVAPRDATASVSETPSAPGAATSAPPAGEPTRVARRASRRDAADATASRPGSRPVPPGATRPVVEVAAVAPPERPPVQLQLTAPGGTRIVWILGPAASDG